MKKIFFGGIVMMTALCITGTNVFASPPGFSKVSDKKLITERRKTRKEKKVPRISEVSYMTKEQFKKDFPGATNMVFKAGNNFDEISYRLKGRYFVAYYDGESNLVGTITPKQLNDLPVRAQKILNTKYKNEGYKIDRIVLFDDNEANTSNMYLYNQQFEDADIYFVELKKDTKTLVVQVRENGDVSYFTKI